MTPRDLRADTAPRAEGGGRYSLALDPGWSFRDPSGGVLTTVALRAAVEEIAEPAFRVRSATTLFASRIEAGSLEVVVRVLRRSAAAAQVEVALRNPGVDEPGLIVVATLGRDLDRGPDWPTFVDVEAPSVPDPELAPHLPDPTPVHAEFRPPIFESVDVRLALGHRWWTRDFPAGPARLARWMRYRVPQRLADGTIDPLALPPLVDTMPPSAIQRLGPEFRPFVAPSLDLTVHFLEPVTTPWLLVDTRTRYAGRGYGAADVQVWDEARRLVATATQMWIFRRAPTGA